jgi:hypothetical protein
MRLKSLFPCCKVQTLLSIISISLMQPGPCTHFQWECEIPRRGELELSEKKRKQKKEGEEVRRRDERERVRVRVRRVRG